MPLSNFLVNKFISIFYEPLARLLGLERNSSARLAQPIQAPQRSRQQIRRSQQARAKRRFPQICADRLFPSLGKASGCVLDESFGVLPKDQQYRCLLRAEHLRNTPGLLAPLRAEKRNTHQFWGWIQKRHSGDTPGVLIYFVQADLTHPSQHKPGQTFLPFMRKSMAQQEAQAQTDECAISMNQSLARTMTLFSEGEHLVVEANWDKFWCLAIDGAYQSYWKKHSQPLG